jgi:hypothetical protein
MNRTHLARTGRIKRVTFAALLALATVAAVAAPGAHGPDGQHLDEKSAAGPAGSVPRVEAKSETFELVGRLQGGELSILIDRYATNEPVLGAKLEVESGPHKAVATFRADQGDYAVADAALLKALATPGEHGLVFTLVAGPDSDLLDGTLVTGGAAGSAAGGAHHDHDHGDHDHTLERAAWTGAAIAGLGLLGLVAWMRQRKRAAALGEGASS